MAFPSHPGTAYSGPGAYYSGMTLRDYFAAKAMQGMLADDSDGYVFKSCAEASYEMADAMLKARAK